MAGGGGITVPQLMTQHKLHNTLITCEKQYHEEFVFHKASLGVTTQPQYSQLLLAPLRKGEPGRWVQHGAPYHLGCIYGCTRASQQPLSLPWTVHTVHKLPCTMQLTHHPRNLGTMM